MLGVGKGAKARGAMEVLPLHREGWGDSPGSRCKTREEPRPKPKGGMPPFDLGRWDLAAGPAGFSFRRPRWLMVGQDRFLDRQWDEHCVHEPRDGGNGALIELGPISALMRYTVRGGVPNEVVGIS